MTSAIRVQCSTNWAIKPSGTLSFCEFVIYPQRVKDANVQIYDLSLAALRRHRSTERGCLYFMIVKANQNGY